MTTTILLQLGFAAAAITLEIAFALRSRGGKS